jgi:Peptidase family M23
LNIRRNRKEAGVGVGLLVLIVFLILVFLGLGLKLASTQAPSIQLQQELKGLGTNSAVTFTVRDPKHRIKSVQVEVLQGGTTYRAPVSGSAREGPKPPSWKFWARHPVSTGTFHAGIGRKDIQTLKEGRATVVIIATNDSWGRFFRGGQKRLTRELPVRFAPPRIEVLTTQHYVNQGGCDMVLFSVSPGTTESGVKVGKYSFPSWPVKGSQPLTRACIFAYPYDVDPSTPANIFAHDDAGNESVANFTYRVFPKKFHTSTINLNTLKGGQFVQDVVPPIMSQMPELVDEGSPIKNFLEINGPLRAKEAQQLIDLSRKTADHLLWNEPFIQLENTKVEAYFADFRTYVYDGQVVDHQTHLGFDLAGTQHMPVVAANDGTVVQAEFFGIYGNSVVIDHGWGIQTLYGHLSSIEVKPGESVRRGQEIGRSGETGLAGGDHLHFTVLLDGIPVNPVEWWDPHWIHDRIMAKLQPYQQ